MRSQVLKNLNQYKTNARRYIFTTNNLKDKVEKNEKLENINYNEKDLKEDISKDLNRLGNDWKSDPNQQEEAKVGKEEFYKEKNKDEEELERPEDYYTG